MTIHVAYTNFWPNFSLKYGLLKHLLDLAFDYDWEESRDPRDADLVLTSVFPHRPENFPWKTIAVIWENIRPDYRGYKFSISSDFDDYGGRNVRCPLWYSQVEWFPGYKNTAGDAWEHGNEPPVPLSVLMTPRTGGYIKREKFCALVASNYEPFRMMAAKALGADIYGGVTGTADARPKSLILKDYTFSLCFENSLFPGYYTEKLLHAWAAGTIPLYFADDKVVEDFNGDAIVNRSDFLTMRSFKNDVKRLYEDNDALEWIWQQPILLAKPSLDPIVTFLRDAWQQIKR